MNVMQIDEYSDAYKHALNTDVTKCRSSFPFQAESRLQSEGGFFVAPILGKMRRTTGSGRWQILNRRSSSSAERGN